MTTDSSDSTGNTKYLQHSLAKSLGTPTDTPNTDNPVAYITVAATAVNTGYQTIDGQSCSSHLYRLEQHFDN
jgi:hypothetical protein